MKTLFKLTLLAFVLAIMTPIAFFAWRMGQPMDAPEFKGLNYYQYLEWIKQQHVGVAIDSEKCFTTDIVTNVGPFISLGLDMVLANILSDEPFPAQPLLTWWRRFEAIQVSFLETNDRRYPTCRIPDNISDDYALSVGAKLPGENGTQ